MSFLTIFFVIFLTKEAISFENFDFKIKTIHKYISSSEKNCTDIVSFFQTRADRFNPLINAIISRNPNILQQAIDLDNYYHTNKRLKGKLHCIPLAVKDNIDIAGIPTTGGIKALKDSIPKKNALVVDRLLDQGAIILFKTNLGELAYGDRISELFGECMNPFDSKRSCGPSSFGSGASVSAGLAVISIGTDTSGSNLYPGSFNGIFSFRPALNSIPLDGIIPLFDKADTVGPFAKHLDDLVTTLSIMAEDPSIEQQYSNNIAFDQLKVGVVSNFVNNFDLSSMDIEKIGSMYNIDPEVKQAFDNTINRLKNLEIPVKEFSLSDNDFENLFKKLEEIFDLTVGCLFASKKESMNLYFSNDQRFGVNSPVKNFDELLQSQFLNEDWKGIFEYSLSLSNDREAICNAFDSKSAEIKDLVLSWYNDHDLDCLIVPTSSKLPDLRENSYDSNSIDSTIIIGYMIGLPIINLPVDYSKKNSDAPDGLPIGLSLIARPERLNKVLKISQAYETNFGIKKLPSRMPLFTLPNTLLNKAIKHELSVSIFILLIAFYF